MEIEFVIAPPAGLELAAMEQIPLLTAAYSHGRVETAASGAAGYWFTRFGVPMQSDWPAAAFRLPAADAGTGYWLCADPVHLQMDRDQLLLEPAAVADLSGAQAGQLTTELNGHFAPDGLRFHAISAREWVLEVPRALDLAAPAPARLAGRPAGAFLPRGNDAGWARRIANEAQMLLYQAAPNALREAAGKKAVNSLWLWGGGCRAPVQPAPAAKSLQVFSSAKHVRELANTGGASSALLAHSWPQLSAGLERSGIDKVLIDLTEIPAGPDWPGILQANWLIPAQSAAKAKKLNFWCTLLAESVSARSRLYRRDLFHFFGRNSLAQYIDNRQNSTKA